MRTGRPTSDKKEYRFTVRINEDTKQKIENGANEKGITPSEFLRRIVKEFFHE